MFLAVMKHSRSSFPPNDDLTLYRAPQRMDIPLKAMWPKDLFQSIRYQDIIRTDSTHLNFSPISSLIMEELEMLIEKTNQLVSAFPHTVHTNSGWPLN